MAKKTKKAVSTKAKSKLKSSKPKATKKIKSKSLPQKSAAGSSLKKIPVRYDSVLSRVQGNTIYVINLEKHTDYFEIDGFAAQAWQLMDGTNSLQKILRQLSETSGQSEAFLTPYLNEFLKQLKEMKLILLK